MPRADKSEWLPLGQACQILGVKESTLRQWANAGRLRAFRTLGGHRRFSREDIVALVRGVPLREGQDSPWRETALGQIRRRIRRRQDPSAAWWQHFDEEGRSRMRVLGRRLLFLAGEYVAQKRRRAELDEEARYLGMEYGRELASRGLRLRSALAAFVFFRGSLHEGLRQTSGQNGAELWNQLMALEDAVLLSMAEAYEGA